MFANGRSEAAQAPPQRIGLIDVASYSCMDHPPIWINDSPIHRHVEPSKRPPARIPSREYCFPEWRRYRHDLPPPGCYIQIEAVVPSVLLVVPCGEVPARPRSWLPRGHPLALPSLWGSDARAPARRAAPGLERLLSGAEGLGVRFRLPR